MPSESLYIGLMSGTSIDAVDAVLVQLSATGLCVQGSIQKPIPPALQRDIAQLCEPGDDGVDLLGCTDRALAMLFASTVTELLQQCGVAPGSVAAIGSHGQTIRHRPGKADLPSHFTLQIGDPSTIAALTGIATVADFRRKDMALGGQGAPLVPACHRFLFHSPERSRVIVNIGGIANVTWLPSVGPILGFDTGPGNRLLDHWISEMRCEPFDRDGHWAASGHSIPALLDRLLRHPFLAGGIPKSTGREDFNGTWLREMLAQSGAKDGRPEDIQATLATFTADTIVDSFGFLPAAVEEIFVCGGGARNCHLMHLLQERAGSVPVRSTESLGLPPQQVEAVAFAWLASQTLARQPGALASVTGARRDSILGGIYFP